jgi:hypothetical protein
MGGETCGDGGVLGESKAWGDGHKEGGGGALEKVPLAYLCFQCNTVLQDRLMWQCTVQHCAARQAYVAVHSAQCSTVLQDRFMWQCTVHSAALCCKTGLCGSAQCTVQHCAS